MSPDTTLSALATDGSACVLAYFREVPEDEMAVGTPILSRCAKPAHERATERLLTQPEHRDVFDDRFHPPRDLASQNLVFRAA